MTKLIMLIFSEHFLYGSITLAGCQINQINVNFHLQKSLKFFDTNSADKIQSKNYEGGKIALAHANKG